MKHQSAIKQLGLLLKKDVRQEFRTREMLFSMGLYAVLVLVVLGVACMQASSFDIQSIAGGLVWVVIVFASLLGLGRCFTTEEEQGSLEALMLAPLDRSLIYLSKMISNILFLLLVEAIVLPLFYVFLLSSANLPVGFWWSALLLLVGTVGIAAVGTLLSAMTSKARGKDVLLAVLFIPAIFPLLYACVSGTTAALLASTGWWDTFVVGLWVTLGYDIIMGVVSWALFDFVISA